MSHSPIMYRYNKIHDKLVSPTINPLIIIDSIFALIELKTYYAGISNIATPNFIFPTSHILC